MESSIPLWRGFNIVDLFSTSVRWKEHFPMDDGLVSEKDFAMVEELGFNFVRIPMSYLFFGKGRYGRTPDETRLFLLDRVVEFGQRYGIHVMLAFHRAPGYCVTSTSPFDFPEKGNLFTDEEEQRDFVTWWSAVAERYKGVPRDALSFDLVNEPLNIPDDQLEDAFLPVIEAITAIDNERLIQVEGAYRFGTGSFEAAPTPASISTLPNVVNSIHVYSPTGLTHFQCPWSEGMPSGGSTHPVPTWPYQQPERADFDIRYTPDGSKVWDREALRDLLRPHIELAQAGHPVHIGEMGAYSVLPHDVFLAYMDDLVGLLAEHDIGYALWNFRGPFGILDSGRADAEYVDFHGHQLDKKLLDVLRAHWG